MTKASIPTQPTRSLPYTARVLPDGGEAADGGPPAVADSDPDDLVIEDLTDAGWPTVAPRICICTFSGE
ncbi:hypothetical protein [Streptomyces sp. NBRC 110028]|uniref:hypothetical protein n=1 Tax=Streptomyces sp. NBRC 110028 TaxID=1621260 RepID=UPI0006E3B2CC|nr:hypothetical protein [Streptomyces sp. NBRC 110028]